AAAIARGGNSIKEISRFLNSEGYSRKNVNLTLKGSLSGWRCNEATLQPKLKWLRQIGLSHDQVTKAVATSPAILGLSIEQNLKPTVEWLLDLSLSEAQVAKAVTAHPAILGYSIERNLKPTVQWLLDLGLNNTQVSKAVATCPATLGYSIERNLKPTVEWLLNLGLSKSRIAKAVASKPNILGYSIEQNLKLLDMGLSNSEVTTAVTCFPSFLGLSIDKNLKPKYSLLLAAFGPTEAGQLVAKCPRILSYSQQRLTERLSVLAELNQTEKLTSALCLTTPAFEKRFSR
ncbi:unnamed protein product, partial [Durusdinium trenchii]